MRWLSVVTCLLLACGRSEPHDSNLPPPQMLCQAVMGEPLVQKQAAWPLGACLDVTWASDAEAHARGLHAALLEWAAAPGTWLCFNPPMPAAASSARTVHVRIGALGLGAVSLAELKFKPGAELFEATATFVPGAVIDHGAYLHTAGQLLGFKRTDGVESVLNASTTLDTLPALTEADLQSVAAVYPACR